MRPTPASYSDRGRDTLRRQRRMLDPIFIPRTVAIIGASDREGSVGRALTSNLTGGSFGGTIVLVNPDHSEIAGQISYPSVADVPEPIDLAVIATPAHVVPDVIRQCVEANVGGAVVISAGFREVGAAGMALEQQVLAEARRGDLRLIGPNSLGVMRPHSGLNATIANPLAPRGTVAFVSQSGTLCSAVLEWSLQENVGFSAFISLGSMIDVGWGDLIDFLADDPHTQSIILYMETVGDARSFLSAAREVALTKPIIVLKTGRTEGAAHAALSHTGSMTGSDDVIDAAFRRCGALRVDSISDLFHMAEVLAKQPRPAGPRLTILTNAGGPGVIAADSLLRNGGQLAELPPATIEALDSVLPANWSRTNPVDLLGDADPQRYAQALDVLAGNKESDGLLVVLTPQSMTAAAATAEALIAYGKTPGKPILASWMGGKTTDEGNAVLNRAQIPTFRYPDTAARMFTYMWRYTRSLRALYETPLLTDEPTDRERASGVLRTAREHGLTLLSEVLSKELLTAYGIPTVETVPASSAEQAVAIAEQIGYPVVLKILSPTITHKSEVGGVRLDVGSAAEVRLAFSEIEAAARAAGIHDIQGVTVQPMIRDRGYELIIGSSVDPQCGPVLLFGSGGEHVELLDDLALALPPLTTTLAQRLIERTRISRVLSSGDRAGMIDPAELQHVLVRFSYLVVEQPWIREIDINPLLISRGRLIALDARVVLHDPATPEDQLPRPAIRPYPAQYIEQVTLRDGTEVTIRPIRPEDEPLLVTFHATLSERSVYMRYFSPISLHTRISHDRLTRMCFIDYAREMALVVLHTNPETGAGELIASGRLTRLHGRNEAEFALLIGDQWQRHGLGTILLSRLVQIGRDDRLDRIVAEILPENTGMRKVAEKVGFRIRRILSDHVLMAEIDL